MKKILRYLFYIIVITVLFLGVFLFYETHAVSKSLTDNKGEYVVLLHGLGRTSFSMQKLATSLSRKGYRVINFNYASRSDTIENLVKKDLINELDKKYTDKDRKINFVTHSMGGVMVRYYLATNEVENLHRVVMLAPPNKGSETADKWANNRFVNFFMGPALRELTTNENSFVNKLPLPNYDVGIIAGKYDEKVSQERTALENMKDFLVVEREHTWIMNGDEVISAITKFLNIGQF
ncbi:MAG: alpha/beta fold hydrolase [Candidatus Magasanikbacteria bacterium]|nr:alpha/beta fold hydrolase [Candidatus Magasanikbacteria bacterium]